MAINKDWHAAHPMPKKPAIAQHLAWHKEYAAECDCRKPPASIQVFIDTKRNTLA